MHLILKLFKNVIKTELETHSWRRIKRAFTNYPPTYCLVWAAHTSYCPSLQVVSNYWDNKELAHLMLGVTAEGEIIQHVALFLIFNCNCSAYSPSVQVTHASGCTSAKVKILDSHSIHNKNVKCYKVKNEMNFKLSVCLLLYIVIDVIY